MAVVADKEDSLLYAELQQKDKDLVLAASREEKLFEENESLKSELSALQREIALLEQSLESQKHKHKVLQEVKKVAELHVSELEEELDTCQCSLEHERAAANSIQESLHRSLKRLREENLQLKDQLTEISKNYEIQLKALKKRLEESETQKWRLEEDSSQYQKFLEKVQNENQTLGRNISSMHKSCEKLYTELEDYKVETGFWRDQYHSQEELLQSRNKELDHSKDLLQQLQLKLDGKDISSRVLHDSTSSDMSLYDELHETGNYENLSSAASPSSDVYIYSDDGFEIPDEKILTLKPAHRTYDRLHEIVDVETENSRETELCWRYELETQNMQLKEEMKTINDQLMLAVQQKFKLQLQIEAWQSDMAQVIESQISNKLRLSHKKEKRRHRKAQDDKIVFRFAPHILKNSWLF